MKTKAAVNELAVRGHNPEGQGRTKGDKNLVSEALEITPSKEFNSPLKYLAEKPISIVFFAIGLMCIFHQMTFLRKFATSFSDSSNRLLMLYHNCFLLVCPLLLSIFYWRFYRKYN